MTVIVNARAYKMTGKQFKKFIAEIKKQFIGKKAIYALREKEKDTVILRNDVFDSYEKLVEAVDKWKKLGYIVFSMNGNG